MKKFAVHQRVRIKTSLASSAMIYEGDGVILNIGPSRKDPLYLVKCSKGNLWFSQDELSPRPPINPELN